MNGLKTMMLMVMLTLLLVWGGGAIAGKQGMTFALMMAFFMNFVTYFFSDKIVLKMYRAQEVSEADAPVLHRIVRRLSQKAGIPMPKVYIIPDMSPNAFATGRSPRHAAVAATEGIMQLLSEEELAGVMAHELAHVMHRDILIGTIAATIAGVIKGLVRPNDHIVMDGLAHACLQEGAHSATSNVHLHGHLNIDSVRRHLRRIRESDTKAAIMVVTESLFSMDSDTPDLKALQELSHEYGATLLVDVAHDLGAVGPGGTGLIGQQGMLGKIDLVMGSFSKTFASNGGFVACNSPALRQYLKYYGSSATFSNALSPVQAATVNKAFEIVRSEKGRRLRSTLMERIKEVRGALAAEGLKFIGDPSPIVPVRVGDEALARLVSRRLPALEIIANLVEYPAVAKGEARLRIQMMPTHTVEHVHTLAARLRKAIDTAQIEHVQHRAAVTGIVATGATAPTIAA